MIAPLVRLAGGDERILVGPETGDDAGVFLLDGHALVATADFITPVVRRRAPLRPRGGGQLPLGRLRHGRPPPLRPQPLLLPGAGREEAEALSNVLQGGAEALASAGRSPGGALGAGRELKYGL